MKKNKKLFKVFIHLSYLTGIIYAFLHYITSPKATMMLNRRLWAYETWIISTLYAFFIWIFMSDMDQDSEFNNPAVKFVYNRLSTNNKNRFFKTVILFMPIFFILFVKRILR